MKNVNQFFINKQEIEEYVQLKISSSWFLLWNEQKIDHKQKVEEIRYQLYHTYGVWLPEIQFIEEKSSQLSTRLSWNYRSYSWNIPFNKQLVSSLSLHQLFSITEKVDDITEHTETKWISKSNQVDSFSYVYDESDVWEYYLFYRLKEMLPFFISRQWVSNQLETVKERYPVLLEELAKQNLSLSVIQKVCQGLVQENISVGSFSFLVEEILDAYEWVTHPADIVSYLREQRKKEISSSFIHEDKAMYAVIMNPLLEESTTVMKRFYVYTLTLSPLQEQQLVRSICQHFFFLWKKGLNPFILVSSFSFRHALVNMLMRHGVHVPVLSVNEVHTSGDIVHSGMISI